MKTNLLRLCLVVVVMLAGASTTLAGQPAQDQPVYGVVNIIQPGLSMVEAGGVTVEVRSPTVFDAGETLTTDAAGMALVTFFYDGTEVVLGPDASLTLNEFSGTAQTDYVIDLTLDEGHLVAGLGAVAALSEGTWTLSTPAFDVALTSGEIDVTVQGDGSALLVVTQGSADVTADGATTTVEANEVFSAGAVSTLSSDGMTTGLEGVCTATANTNLNIRVAPTEDSRRLGGVVGEQVLWVRAATEGRLWLQVYYQTPAEDLEARNFGWVYGPATTLDGEGCADLLRAPLDAVLYGGPGIDEGLGDEGETEPIEEAG